MHCKAGVRIFNDVWRVCNDVVQVCNGVCRFSEQAYLFAITSARLQRFIANFQRHLTVLQ